MRLFLTSLIAILLTANMVAHVVAHVGEGVHVHPETSYAAIAIISVAVFGLILWMRK